MIRMHIQLFIFSFALTLASWQTGALAGDLKLYDTKGNILTNQELSVIDSKVQQQDTILIDPSLAKKAEEKNYSIQIRSFTGLDSYNPDIVDITHSYLGIVLGNQNFPKFLNEFRETSKQTTLVQFTAKISLVPILLRSSVETQANALIDTQTQDLKNQYIAATATKIHQQISSLIQTNTLTPAEAQIMEAKFISSAKTLIEQQLEQAREQLKKSVDNRLDSIDNDYTFEEFALKIGHKALETQEGALLIFGQVGKSSIDAGFGPTTGINSHAPLVWWGPRGMTTSSTGVLQMGLEWISKNNTKIGLEAYFFHERFPTLSGRRLMTQLIYMSPSQFDQDQQFWKINSNLQRFYVKMPSKVAKTEDQFYFSTGTFNGRQSVGAGALTRIMPKVTVQVDMTFNRPQFDYAITESLMFHATDRLVFYFVNDNAHNIKSNYDAEAPFKDTTIGSAGIGATYRLVNILVVGIQATVDINAECKYFYKNVSSSLDSKLGCGGGILLNAQY